MSATAVSYLTTAEVAAEIRTSEDYVARQCNAGHLIAKKVGNEWRVHRDDLERFMRGGGKAPAARKRGGRRRAA